MLALIVLGALGMGGLWAIDATWGSLVLTGAAGVAYLLALVRLAIAGVFEDE